MTVDEYGLTERERRFCEHYLNNGNNGQNAGIAVGFSEKTARIRASQWLTRINVKKYVTTRMKEVFDKIGATSEWRAEMLKKTIEASFDGRTSKNGLVNPTGVISGIAEMNKMEGAYAPEKREVNVSRVDELVDRFDREY